jgi:F-type H+-transporting ATPase subunit delta
MAENITIARPYGEAVFQVAEAGARLGEWSNTLATMASVTAQPEVRAAIGDPKITADRLYGLFVSLCGDALAVEVQNLARTLIANRRLALVPEIRDIYEELKNAREGVIEARITTAFPLDDAQLAALIAGLERRFRRTVNPQVSVDGELIGGVRVQVGDELIDGSMRGRLDAMAAALKS